ncbi:hypothetical protein [Actinokineospora sp.]|uniref:hypothetical protein n=1 Tax=Actinokineospora sp. TaxID=1872133 RepID=UPI003D6B9E0E
MTYLPFLPQNATLLEVFRAFPDRARPLLDYHQVLLRGPHGVVLLFAGAGLGLHEHADNGSAHPVERAGRRGERRTRGGRGAVYRCRPECG